MSNGVNRLRTFLELGGKCTGIVLQNADQPLEKTVDQVVKGALGFNGQRRIALKGIMVHESILDDLVTKLWKAVDDLPMGLPFEDGIKINRLTEAQKPDFLRELLDDALSTGSKVASDRGGIFDRSLVSLTVVSPVDWKNARLAKEEQFGLYWIHVPV
ncbi:hypothetical protein HDU93_006901 [Gonapodya sp. JEL0774]|nr:hypothetical protein HDU93_006901 [Gonapodya sp. JEL0774]